MKKLLIISFLLAIASQLYSQESEPIITDRPTQSAAATVMPKGNFLVETGFTNDQIIRGFKVRTFNALFRYGLSDKIEIRLTQNYLGRKIESITDAGFSATTIGTKVYLASEDNSFANMSVIAQISIPFAEYAGDDASYEVRFNFQNTLSEKLSLGYNLGGVIVVEEFFFLYTAVLGLSIDEKWSIFAEPYAYIGKNFDQRFDAGIIYLYKNNIQFDASFGIGLSEVSPDSFVGFGAAIGF